VGGQDRGRVEVVADRVQVPDGPGNSDAVALFDREQLGAVVEPDQPRFDALDPLA
jgi:hypothetical protein